MRLFAPVIFLLLVPAASWAEDSESLRARVERLQKAVSGDPSLDVRLQRLFPVDLRNETAVGDRVLKLQVAIATLSTQTSSTGTTAAALQLSVLILEKRFLSQDQTIRSGYLEAQETRRAFLEQQELAKERLAAAEQQANDAEADRKKALEEAEKARSAAVKALREQIATIAGAKKRLAAEAKALSLTRRQKSLDSEARFKKVHLLLREAEQVEKEHALRATIATLEGELDKSLGALESALIEAAEDLDLTEVPYLQRIDVGASLEEQAAFHQREAALVELESYAQEVGDREQQARLLAVATWFSKTQMIAESRARLMARRPVHPTQEIFTSQALVRARLEIRALRTTVLARIALRADTLLSLGAGLRDLKTPALSTVGWPLVKLLLVLILALWLRNRGSKLLNWFHRYELGRVRSLAALRRVRMVENTAERFGSPVLYLVSIFLARYLLGSLAQVLEVSMLFVVAIWLGYYWLLRILFSTLVVALARRRQIPISLEIRTRVERSATWVGRTVFAAGLFQSLAEIVLGFGILYQYARLILLFIILLVAIALLRTWRQAVARAYLKVWPTGMLARAVEATQNKSYGLFVVLAAFLYVAVRGSYTLGREFILQFDQARKALAFIFRKRLERKVEELGGWEGRIELLPPPLLSSFSQLPLKDESLRIDRFPGLDKLKRDLELWQDGRAKGSFLVQAPRGFGKTTWLHRAKSEIEDLPAHFLSFQRNGTTAEGVAKQLAKQLKIEGEGVEEVTKAIRAGDRRVFFLDDLHNLFLREIGGGDALDGLMSIIEHTGHRVMWIAAVDELTWRFISAARPKRVRFRSDQRLGGWSEEDIRHLLIARAAAAGVVHEFEDLVVDADDAYSQSALARSSEAYTRLIWDYSDGCPLVAVHFWLRSLAPLENQESRVRVRLFKAPEEERLGRIPEEAVFLYSAIALHENLSIGEAARVLRFPEPFCEALLIRGHEEGYLSRQPNTGRYLLNVHWYRTIVRFLRRRHVLAES